MVAKRRPLSRWASKNLRRCDAITKVATSLKVPVSQGLTMKGQITPGQMGRAALMKVKTAHMETFHLITADLTKGVV